MTTNELKLEGSQLDGLLELTAQLRNGIPSDSIEAPRASDLAKSRNIVYGGSSSIEDNTRQRQVNTCMNKKIGLRQ